jgi:DNA repair ATPase RecN
LKRVDNEFSRLAADIEALEKQDAIRIERQQVYVEIVKRLDEQLIDVADIVNMKREMGEKLDLHRAGIRRSEERLGVIEEIDEQMHQQVEDVQRAVALIESKDKNLRDRLAVLQEQVGESQVHVAEQFQKAQSLLERQKKRLIEDLERDIREIKVNVYRPVEE